MTAQIAVGIGKSEHAALAARLRQFIVLTIDARAGREATRAGVPPKPFVPPEALPVVQLTVS